MPVEPDGAPRELRHPRRYLGRQRVGAHAVDHDVEDVEQRRARRAGERRQRVVQHAVRRPAKRADDGLLVRLRPVQQAELQLSVAGVERIVEREVAGERGDGHVVAGLGPREDEVARHEAAGEAERGVQADPAPHRAHRALPDSGRQHALDGQAHEEVEPEEGERLWVEQRERHDAQVIAVLDEEQAVEDGQAQAGGRQKHAEGQDDPRTGDQHRGGHQHQDERDVGEHGQVAEVGHGGVHPAHDADRRVAPQIPDADDHQQRDIDRGESVRPAQQAAPDARGPRWLAAHRWNPIVSCIAARSAPRGGDWSQPLA